MKLFFVTIILLLPLICFAQENVIKNKGPLALIIEADKKEYSLGDDIIISCKIKNLTNRAISFYRNTNPTHLNLIVVSSDGKKCHRADSSQVMIGSNSLISLRRNEEFEYLLTGKILEGKRNIPKGKYKLDGFQEVYGLYIQFSTWSVYLDSGFGRYNIQAKYKDGSWVEYTTPEYFSDNKPVYPSKDKVSARLKSKWRGTLISEPVTIEITQMIAD